MHLVLPDPALNLAVTIYLPEPRRPPAGDAGVDGRGEQ
jgi:hypothetical protein